MSSKSVITQPPTIQAEGGYVLLDGPGGAVATLSADAAEAAGHALIAAAQEARGQEPASPAK